MQSRACTQVLPIAGPRLIRAFIAVMLASASTSGSFAEPPKVIRTIPSHHATDVDPATAVIAVEFDQDMDTRGFSWAKHGQGFPSTTGPARWKDARSCILPVKLEPGRVYTLGVNSTTLRGFRSTSGEPAAPHVLTFRTKGSNAPPPELLDAKKNMEAIRQLREAIDQKYSYRDLRKVDWTKQFARCEAALREAWTTDEFAAVAAELLAAAQDEHISIQNGNFGFETFHGSVVPNFAMKTLPKVVPGWKEVNPAVATGRFDDGIAYLLINTWDARKGADVRLAWEAIKGFTDEKALILDVRPNEGGDEMLALRVAQCFMTEQRVYAKHRIRDPSKPTGFTEPANRSVGTNFLAPRFKGRVAVLIGPMNVSSNESFILMMKQAPSVKLIGQRTYGSSGNPQPVTLANGLIVKLPKWQALLPDGTLLEGKGIEPEITVPTKLADFKDRDPVIEKALEWLRGEAKEKKP